MSYQGSLEAVGASILAISYFGSYQGDWWAKVEYQGELGWVHGYYGSCSMCDAFEAEFGWNDDQEPDYQKRLIDFGKRYLNNLYTQEEAEKESGKNLDWDGEAQEMLEFIKNNKIE